MSLKQWRMLMYKLERRIVLSQQQQVTIHSASYPQHLKVHNKWIVHKSRTYKNRFLVPANI